MAVMEDVKNLLQSITSVKVSYILRSGNDVAHQLACRALLSEGGSQLASYRSGHLFGLLSLHLSGKSLNTKLLSSNTCCRECPSHMISSSLSKEASTLQGFSLTNLTGFSRKADPEPGRCRRTDGKKWMCSKEVFPGSKYFHGLKEDVDERVFFSEASGTVRSVPYSTDDPRQPTPLRMSSFQDQLKQRSCSVLQKKEPQKPLRRFFDKWPPKNRDSWLDLEDGRSNRAQFPTTQLSISTPEASPDFPISNSRTPQNVQLNKLMSQDSQHEALAKWVWDLEHLQSLMVRSTDDGPISLNLRVKSLSDPCSLSNLYLLGKLERSHLWGGVGWGGGGENSHQTPLTLHYQPWNTNRRPYANAGEASQPKNPLVVIYGIVHKGAHGNRYVLREAFLTSTLETLEELEEGATRECEQFSRVKLIKDNWYWLEKLRKLSDSKSKHMNSQGEWEAEDWVLVIPPGAVAVAIAFVVADESEVGVGEVAELAEESEH
ncbi:hypothetical protein HHK36_014384 [Tetracentron sinense]|uniref:Growth-regulating factor n=1 Tax=Tetracentron sinense TaxID=13715 RepID=A0A834Z8M4_TETSI|nr:hypothetical protein HHK36_014384 [Tetracentron sinense]